MNGPEYEQLEKFAEEQCRKNLDWLYDHWDSGLAQQYLDDEFRTQGEVKL